MILTDLIDFVFPKRCAGCGEWDILLCEKCRGLLEDSVQICPMCGEESVMGWVHGRCKKKTGMDGLITLFQYDEPTMRKVVDNIKYDFSRELIHDLLENYSFESGLNFDYVVPVPLFYYRENWRGFNQAEEIGNVVGSRIGTKVEKILERNRNTAQQALLKTKEDREKNIRGAFEVSILWRSELKGKKVLLVDDVFTSGADMRECTRMLKNGGVKVVWGLSLAH